jgi:meiotically up-regulated gene 157 (Mug157) protein
MDTVSTSISNNPAPLIHFHKHQDLIVVQSRSCIVYEQDNIFYDQGSVVVAVGRPPYSQQEEKKTSNNACM